MNSGEVRHKRRLQPSAPARSEALRPRGVDVHHPAGGAPCAIGGDGREGGGAVGRPGHVTDGLANSHATRRVGWTIFRQRVGGPVPWILAGPGLEHFPHLSAQSELAGFHMLSVDGRVKTTQAETTNRPIDR